MRLNTDEQNSLFEIFSNYFWAGDKKPFYSSPFFILIFPDLVSVAGPDSEHDPVG
jgi:hypothetical protein